MEYMVKRIGTPEEIDRCMRFSVDYFQWRCVKTPRTYGYMGYWPGHGLCVRMRCEETDPLRRCSRHWEAVCRDSAMEVFLSFAQPGKERSNEELYLNFEVNANAALYAKYGRGRKDRLFLPDRMYEKTGVTAHIDPEGWEMSLLVPEELLRQMCGWRADGSGTQLYCNFYKISEDPAIEHYASFAPIESERPNFHLPVCFAKAVLEQALNG